MVKQEIANKILKEIKDGGTAHSKGYYIQKHNLRPNDSKSLFDFWESSGLIWTEIVGNTHMVHSMITEQHDPFLQERLEYVHYSIKGIDRKFSKYKKGKLPSQKIQDEIISQAMDIIGEILRDSKYIYFVSSPKVFGFKNACQAIDRLEKDRKIVTRTLQNVEKIHIKVKEQLLSDVIDQI